ncbi:hypothetical protein CSKR_105677 [Clonorchis sinensis]|uniref:Uncharacterized protein n=2 Tax=Clonorchis sinensis TaxID=79923 RepID=A0A8T1MGS6_CLOSI|nr:hypothetical protein CSKR_105677 [Clonorchis sinensis]GAA51145.1 hypothetical protein CLF_105644 [Clonorchis sinensis]
MVFVRTSNFLRPRITHMHACLYDFVGQLGHQNSKHSKPNLVPVISILLGHHEFYEGIELSGAHHGRQRNSRVKGIMGYIYSSSKWLGYRRLSAGLTNRIMYEIRTPKLQSHLLTLDACWCCLIGTPKLDSNYGPSGRTLATESHKPNTIHNSALKMHLHLPHVIDIEASAESETSITNRLFDLIIRLFSYCTVYKLPRIYTVIIVRKFTD